MALTQISTAGVKDDAVTAGKIPANAVGSSELADNAVDTAAIAADAVTTAKIAAGNITATELGSDSVTGAKIAAGAINNANKLQDSIITGAKIGSGTITDGNLATNSVTTGKIANDAVTVDKVADDAIGVAQLSASGTASSSTFLRGDNSWTTVNTDLVSDTSPQLGGDLDTNGNHILLDDSRQLRLGDDNDMQINHTGSHAYIDNGTGHMYLRGSSNSQILLKPNGSDNSVRCMPGGAAELYYGGSKKFETTAGGVTVTGGLTTTAAVAASSMCTFSAGLKTGTDEYKVQLGAGDDLELWHSTNNNSYIKNSTGELKIASDNIALMTADQSEKFIDCNGNGNVELYYNNSKKLETTDAGGTLTGTWTGVGKVLQVVHTAKTDTFSESLGQGTLSSDTGLNVSITPSSSSNKILIIASVNMSCSNDNRNATTLVRGGSAIDPARGDTSNSNQRVSSAANNTSTSFMSNHTVNYLDTANTTSAITYGMRLSHGRNSTATVYLNRAGSEASGSDRMRAASFITAMEIAA